MLPTLFPHTYIRAADLEKLHLLFNSVVVLQPAPAELSEAMRKWTDEQFLQTRIPIDKDNQRLEQVLAGYRSWAAEQHLGDLAFLKSHSPAPPFRDASLPSQIRSQIARNLKNSEDSFKPDRLLNDRVFLSMAHSFDQQNDDLSQDLGKFSVWQQELLSDLCSTDAVALHNLTDAKETSHDNREHYMIEQRLKAWAHLWHYDASPSKVYVTTSKDAYAHLFEYATGAQELINYDHLAIPHYQAPDWQKWQQQFSNRMVDLLSCQWTQSIDLHFLETDDLNPSSGLSISIGGFPNRSPLEVFNELADLTNAPQSLSPENSHGNTLIIYLGPPK